MTATTSSASRRPRSGNRPRMTNSQFGMPAATSRHNSNDPNGNDGSCVTSVGIDTRGNRSVMSMRALAALYALSVSAEPASTVRLQADHLRVGEVGRDGHHDVRKQLSLRVAARFGGVCGAQRGRGSRPPPNAAIITRRRCDTACGCSTAYATAVADPTSAHARDESLQAARARCCRRRPALGPRGSDRGSCDRIRPCREDLVQIIAKAQCRDAVDDLIGRQSRCHSRTEDVQPQTPSAAPRRWRYRCARHQWSWQQAGGEDYHGSSRWGGPSLACLCQPDNHPATTNQKSVCRRSPNG